MLSKIHLVLGTSGRQSFGGKSLRHLFQQQLPAQQQNSLPCSMYLYAGLGQFPPASDGPEITSLDRPRGQVPN